MPPLRIIMSMISLYVRHLPSIAATLLLLLGVAPLPAEAAPTIVASADWPTVGGTESNTRHSTLEQINLQNIQRLAGAWVTELDAVTRSPPIVSRGVVYINDTTAVYSIDARTGSKLWQFKPEASAPARGGVTLHGGVVYCGLTTAHVVALDAKSGRLLWKAYVGNTAEEPASNEEGLRFNQSQLAKVGVGGTGHLNPKTGWIYNAPVYLNGVVITGLSGGDLGARGGVIGLDAGSGKVLWRFDTIPRQPGSPGAQTWPIDGAALNEGGGAVWVSGAADPELGIAYFGTGNPVPQVGGELRSGNNLYTSSVIALDAKTGTLRWQYQLVHHDLWEMDSGTPLVLYTAKIEGRARKAVAAMRTDGYLFVLDRQTGKPLFPVEERPVRQDLRLYTAATQPFPVQAQRFGPECADPQTLPAGFRAGCYFDPVYFDTPDVAIPFMTVRQAPMSYDPDSGYFYVMGSVVPWWYRRLDNPAVLVASVPPLSSEYGIYGAIDSRTFKVVWQRRSNWAMSAGSGALTTAGGLLFHSEGDGSIVASNSRTGARVWSFQTGFLPGSSTNGNSGGVPAAAHWLAGKEFVVVPMGKSLWAFTLGGSLGPRPALPAPPSQYGFPGAVERPANGQAGEISIGTVIALSEHTLDEYAFVPQILRVEAGQPIKWINRGIKPHTIVCSDRTWTTGEIQPGQSATMSAPKPGTYIYFAEEYPWAKGQLIIGGDPPSAGASQSTDAGVFSGIQAARGRSIYLAHCSTGCHSASLNGGERAPALAGGAFLQRWRDSTVDTLYQRIRATMPQTRPGSLSDSAYVDIVAFLLSANGMTSGPSDLVADSKELQAIHITVSK